jgi:hypothetical protein
MQFAVGGFDVLCQVYIELIDERFGDVFSDQDLCVATIVDPHLEKIPFENHAGFLQLGHSPHYIADCTCVKCSGSKPNCHADIIFVGSGGCGGSVCKSVNNCCSIQIMTNMSKLGH